MAIQTQAGRLSASLGVGKIRDKNLVQGLFGFVQEGIRFAFSTEYVGSQEDLPLGARLTFLLILTKYVPSNWFGTLSNLNNVVANAGMSTGFEMTTREWTKSPGL